MNSHKRLTPYLSGTPHTRAYSQENYLARANVSFQTRNMTSIKKMQNISHQHMQYGPQCQNHQHHCCCQHHHNHPYQSYFPTYSEDKINDLKQEVKRQRFENKLLLKELQSKELYRNNNSELNHKLQERIDEISKLNKKIEEKRRQIQILKESNDWLKKQSLQLRKAIEQADKVISEKDKKISELEVSHQGDYMGMQKKLIQMQRQVVEYKQVLQKFKKTHKVEEQWRRESARKIQNKLGWSKNEISLCIENEEYYPLSRSTQTYMSGVDIDYGYGNVSKMQDRLCEMINQNIISQDTIFRRIRTIQQDLAKGMQAIASIERMENQIQLQTLRMSRS